MSIGNKNSEKTSNLLKWLTIFNTLSVLIIGAFIGYVYFFMVAPAKRGNNADQAKVQHVDMAPLLIGAPAIGSKNPKVDIVVFNSFTCGFCRKVNPVLQQLLKKYPDKVRVVYRHFIRNETDIVAANAVECAGEQNKFWQMQDQIFGDNANEFNFKRYAQNAGLNVDQFNKCLVSAKYTSKANNDSEMGRTLGVQGTPTFVINGDVMVGYRPFESFESIIKKSL